MTKVGNLRKTERKGKDKKERKKICKKKKERNKLL